MKNVDLVSIEITGPTSSGKSAVLRSIEAMLHQHNLCTAYLDPAERNNPSNSLIEAENHEMPNCDSTIFLLSESNVSRDKNPDGREE